MHNDVRNAANTKGFSQMLKSAFRKAAVLFSSQSRKTPDSLTQIQNPSGRLLVVFDGRTQLWPGMGALLYNSEPVFKSVIDRCNSVVGEFICGSILDTLANSGKPAPYGDVTAEILHTASLGAYQLALFDLCRSKGIRPDAVTGLCLGEWLCLYAAGTLTLEETMRVVCSGMQMITRKTSRSALMLVQADSRRLKFLNRRLGEKLFVCGQASPRKSLVVCSADHFDAVANCFRIEGIIYHVTKLDWPYHTKLMSHDREVMRAATEGISAAPLESDLYSSGLGIKVSRGSLLTLNHWHSIPRAEIRFEKAVRKALDDGFENFLLFGAYDYLRDLLKECAESADKSVNIVNVISLKHSELESIQIALRELENSGISEKQTEITPRITSIELASGASQAVNVPTPPSTDEYGKNPYDYADPYPFYRWLLEKGGAVFSPGENTWLIARHEHVAAVLKDPRLSKQTGNPSPSPIDLSMLFQDAPEHSRLRGTLATAFTPGNVSRMEQSIEGIVEDLLGRLDSRETIDFISEFAMPLTVGVIADILSVPPEDRKQLGQWAAATVPLTGPDGAPLSKGYRVLGEAVQELGSYFRKHFLKKTAACPHLARVAPDFHAGSALSADEVVGAAVLMMIAGHETTVNLIGNGLLCFLRNPDQMEKLRRNPALIEDAVEEMLRFESPVARGTFRVAREDFEISGIIIPKNGFVAPLIGAANRDPRVFANPDEFNIERKGNKHIAFGNGPHYCLGAQLAKLEARIAFTQLLKKFQYIQLADPFAAEEISHPDWIRSTAVRGLKTFPISLQE